MTTGATTSYKTAGAFSGIGVGVILGILVTAVFASLFSNKPNEAVDRYVLIVTGAFACAGAYFGYRVGATYQESRKLSVAPGTFVVRLRRDANVSDGTIFREGDRYSPDDYVSIVSLGPRLVHATHDAGTHGVDEDLYMQVTYAPDESHLPRFVFALQECDRYLGLQDRLPKLDALIGKAMAGKLCMSTQPDFADLDFSNIEDTFGIKITSRESKPRRSKSSFG